MERASAKLIGTSWCRYSLFYLIYLACLFDNVFSDCPMPDEKFANGRVIYPNLNDFNLSVAPENYVLQFRCYKRYERIGPHVILCHDGNWTAEPPRCVLRQCPLPPDIEHGCYKTRKHRVVGSTAEYKCDDGFTLENEKVSSLTCILQENNVAWSGDMPSCVKQTKCPDPGSPPHGSREGECCATGNILEYSCKKGYELQGKKHITCLGGKWSAERPRCRPVTGHCPDPPIINNGNVTGYNRGDYYEPYEEAEVVCNPGYAFYGDNEFVMCQENFEWDIEFGECIETFCTLPEKPGNGTILEFESANSTEFSHGFELSYTCNSGYRLIGDNYRSCDKGNWTGNEPYCEVIKCHNPGYPENGNRYGDDFNIGRKVVFSCFQGFTLIGSVERYCLPNGQWSGELTRCNLESNYCSDPGIPINGMKQGNSYKKGDKVEFRCYPGFTLVGSEVRQCLTNHLWSGKEVRCLGAYDFDDALEVGEILKVAINEKAEEQAEELQNHNNALARMGNVLNGGMTKSIQMKRILDLTYTGRFVLYFIFDVSGSVREQNFKISINFAKALVKKIGISANGARAAAITFSSKVHEEFNPVDYTTTEAVLDALDRINYTSGGTATSSVLRYVREVAIPLSAAYFGKKGVKYVLFILTDGKANTGGDPVDEADKLKKLNHAEIYCVGITGSFVKNTLYSIASSDKHVFILNNYKTLEWLIQEITNGTIDYSKCGLGLEKVGDANQRARVVGGNQVIEPWPWMAALYITDKGPDEAELRCGGSIIGNKWILTAAHCLFEEGKIVPRNIHQIFIKLGLTDVQNFTHLQEFESAKFYIHEKYNHGNYDNDIALIMLNGVIEYNAYVRPICLPTKDSSDSSLYKPKENTFATGWGHTKVVRQGEIVSVKALRNLKELRLPLQPRETCLQSLLNSGGKREQFTESMLCAGSGDGSGDTCVGDSGGPLMQSQLNTDGHIFWTQIGLVSWGIGCGQLNTYGFYTHVQNELDWIKRVFNSEYE